VKTRLASLLGALAMVCLASSLPAPPACAAAGEATYFFLSDLHIGMGQRVPGKYANQEDFRWDAELDALLDHFDAASASNATLVLLGDTFELWQSPFQICTTEGAKFGCVATDCVVRADDANHGCTEEEALRRLRFVLDQHKSALEHLCAFAGRGANQVVVVPGNHDGALVLPALAAEVAARCPPPAKLSVAKSGYWTSPDKRVYGDHGHAFDKVNSFPGWPEPFDTRDGKRILQRPWGESMVQQFYNQYEELLPIIDNLTGETDGVRLGVDALGENFAVDAAGRFLRFLAFDTSLRQKLAFLGQQERDDVDNRLGGAAAADAEWDVAAVRTGDAGRFLIESMPFDTIRAAAEQARPTIDWRDVSDDNLTALCDQRKVLIEYYSRRPDQLPAGKSISPCALRPGNAASLGYVADKVLGLDLRNRRKHIERMSREIGRQFDVYVYGHTHKAVEPTSQKIASRRRVSIVNTGAFQRLVTVKQLTDLARSLNRPLPEIFAQLTPEQLPACYSFVRVAPYGDGIPKAELLWWTQSQGSWTEAGCAPYPP